MLARVRRTRGVLGTNNSNTERLVCSSEASAIPVTPGGYENVAGASENCIPFTCRGVTRYQQVYDAAGFGGASGVVGSIAFRLDEIDQFQDGPFGTTDNGSFSLHLDLLVTLSHTSENVNDGSQSTRHRNRYQGLAAIPGRRGVSARLRAGAFRPRLDRSRSHRLQPELRPRDAVDFVHALPEPGTLLLLLTGLFSLLPGRRRSAPQLTGAF